MIGTIVMIVVIWMIGFVCGMEFVKWVIDR